jgi:F-type H+-transporting ATPase subunit delta
MTCLPAISSSYSILADELSGVVRPIITSALPLGDAQIAEIKAALEKSTGKTVKMTVKIDSELIGGVVTQIGDKVLDGSVKTQLTRIEDILQKG